MWVVEVVRKKWKSKRRLIWEVQELNWWMWEEMKSKREIIVDNKELQRANTLLAQTVNNQNATIQMMQADMNGAMSVIRTLRKAIENLNNTVTELLAEKSNDENNDAVPSEWDDRPTDYHGGTSTERRDNMEGGNRDRL